MMRGSVTLLGRIWLSTMWLRASANAWAAWSMAGCSFGGNAAAYRGAARAAPCRCPAGVDQPGRQPRYTAPPLRPVRWQSGDAADCKSSPSAGKGRLSDVRSGRRNRGKTPGIGRIFCLLRRGRLGFKLCVSPPDNLDELIVCPVEGTGGHCFGQGCRSRADCCRATGRDRAAEGPEGPTRHQTQRHGQGHRTGKARSAREAARAAARSAPASASRIGC